MKRLSLVAGGLAGAVLGLGVSLLTSRSLGAREPAPDAAAPKAAEAPAPAAVRIDLGDAPVRGPGDAPVTLVIFADFQCPFCGRVEPTLAELQKTYGRKLRLVWKNEPVSGHAEALPAAQAALAAHEQGKFWEYHDRLFANQDRLGPALYEETAREVGLDLDRFRTAARSVATRNRVIDDARQGGALGVHGTPTFFVNGQILVGAQPIESFRAAIDQALAAR